MQEQKRASVKDIAAKLNISLSTVHKALTGKPGVSEGRRAEVLAVAEELGYVVNTAAQSLARNDINLAIIMPMKWQEYFAELKAGMESEIAALAECRVNGSFIYITDDTRTEELCESIKETGADLIIVCSSSSALSKTVIRATENVNLPIFRVGGGVDNPGSACDVTVDAPLSGRIAADFFACAVSGEIRAAVFTGFLDIAIHKAKTESFSERIGLYAAAPVIVCETDDNEEIAYAAVCELFEKHPDINCIYISTSTSASVCRYIEENGLAGKVLLVGTDVFDTLRENIKRGVMQATIYQNQEKVGRYAIRAAYEYLYMKNSYVGCEKEPERNVLISPALLLRANME
ncbi:MAG: LacI family DNA-binding transcriptional regulator [Oscillospiraceae bacterium]|nr:LacI family DNA-binding transcriptional regulator [Oscillospiraceae bacterium]